MLYRIITMKESVVKRSVPINTVLRNAFAAELQEAAGNIAHDRSQSGKLQF